ncbi:Ubiquitin thioesterase OTU1 [Fusarium oxysporum f. sp. cubense]|uniref:Ubiquitin thioesterase OTU n=1 Tax=Fusarium oxysporum f. sp. cubense TaxID=61366 RepID=A0A559LSQ4_FUSOC|nr:Ubiquitin thioesterase OTU1 [Fusarium oxysporum f. sp. cubense]
MRARYKGPAGTGILEIPDDATVKVLFDELRAKTGITNFGIKYGPPMAMKALEASQSDQIARSLGLHGETLTIVPEDVPPPAPTAPLQTGAAQYQAMASRAAKRNESPEDVNVPWPEQGGTLLLRVMPSDNSCLFTAFGGALQDQIPAQRLRRMMADYIVEHPEDYSEAVLGSPPSQYCRSIQDPDRWGGGIELSILSSIFDIQICTFDVQAQNLINFGENKRDRCILVYSGIHYDRVAFSLSDYPHDSPTYPPEMDRTVWPTDDDEVLEKTRELVEKLNKAHYYTDTEGLILRCDVPGCDWIGSGQREGQKHAELTGHVDLSEIQDEGDNVLRKCDTPGCDFIGQGDKVMRQHSADTAHERFSIIPDW